MIHSLSGGVIAENEIMRFAKVRLAEGVAWYLAPFLVEAGDKVLVPYGGAEAEGEVERVELCSPQTAPVSVKRAREILSLLPKNS